MMRSSPLRLKELFFPQVSVKALNPEKSESVERELDLDSLDISFEFDFAEVDKTMNAGLGIITQNSPSATPTKSQSYEVHIEVFATFDVVSPDHTDPLATYLRKVAAASALIGAAREQIALMTSRGPWGVVMLPMISMDRVVGLPPKKEPQAQPVAKKLSQRKKSAETSSVAN